MLVVYNKPNMLRIEPLTKASPRPGFLVPGVNDVDESEFEAALDTFPLLADHLANDVVEVVTARGKDGGEKRVEPSDFGKLTEKEAIKVVKQTTSPDLLMQWAASDKRPAVLRAVDEQKKAYDAAAEPPIKG